METLLRIRELTVRFREVGGGEVPAVEDVGFDLHGGEAVGLLGESGCGKTTTALAILGLLPTAARVVRGSVFLAGEELLGLAEGRLAKVRGARVSLVAQHPDLALNPVLRVGKQIEAVIRAHRRWDRRRVRAAASDSLAEVGLGGSPRLARAYPHQLSGGQQQRVALAMALACRPALLVADEPTSALDSTLRAEILALLAELKARHGLGLLLISHDPGALALLADRVLVMYAGRIVEEGPATEVFGRPLHPYTRGLLASAPPGRPPRPPGGRLRPIPGAPPDPVHPPPGCRFAPRCPDLLETCTRREPAGVRPVAGRCVRCFLHGG